MKIFKPQDFDAQEQPEICADIANKILADYVKGLPTVWGSMIGLNDKDWQYYSFKTIGDTHSARLIDIKELGEKGNENSI